MTDLSADASGALSYRVLRSGRGRALFIDRQDALYVGRAATIWRSGDDGRTWSLDCALPPGARIDPRNWLRATRRLFRRQFQALEVLGDGTRIAIARTGIHRAEPGATTLRCTFPIRRGSRPLNLARDADDRIVFGEYGTNSQRGAMHLYASVDRGATFQVCHTFAAGVIRHVHGVAFDAAVPGFWVFTGDSDDESGIGILSADLGRFTWVARGSQDSRVVQAIRADRFLVYGTDSDVAGNVIARLDVAGGGIERLHGVEGSSLYAGRFGGVALISTCVEPSRVNRSRDVVLYGSRDLASWTPLVKRRRDGWPGIFQFATFVLARSESRRSIALVSGQALRGEDERYQVVELSGVESREAASSR